MTHYDHAAGKAYCEFLGLQWDEAFAARADQIAHEEGLTQRQFDVLVREYSWRVKWMFTPRNYTWLGRALLALHFINPFAGD